MADTPDQTEPDRGRKRRARLQAILDGNDPRLGRWVGFGIQVLILLSALSIAIESLPNLKPWMIEVLVIEEAIIVSLFTIEYAARIYAAPSRRKYIFSFFGLIDLMAILPSLLLIGVDLRAMRALRALRLLTLFKLMRYQAALQRLGRAWLSVGPEMLIFMMIALIVLYLTACGIYFFENPAQPDAFASIFHSLWWAVVTLTTVGYGDVYPITAGGRIFTGIIVLLALGVIAVPTGLIATALAEERQAERQRSTSED